MMNISVVGKPKVEVLELNDSFIRLKVENVPLPLINAVRRAALEYVPSMAVDFIYFRTNTSVLHDEIIAHRIGMIPLTSEEALRKYKPPEECMEPESENDPQCYAILMLEAKASDDETAIVYSGELRPITDPSVRPVSEKIPIVTLGPGQRIELEAYARLGRGVEHIKWSPATVAVSTYVADIEVKEELCDLCRACVKYCPLNALRIEGGKLIADSSRCTFCRQCVKVCEKDAISLRSRPNEFKLYIESSGSLRPETIVVEAVKEVIRRLDTLLKKIEGIDEAGEE